MSKQNSPGLLLRNAGIFNPVLVQAVGLCPVIAMATSLKGASILAGISAIVITLTEFIASAFLKPIPRWVRIGLYIIIGGALVAPFMVWFEKVSPELFGTLGIYLPIMAVNSLIVLRCERFAVKIKPLAAIADGATASVGYAAVLIFVGIVREILGAGSIGGFKFWNGRAFSGFLLPFGGFIILGFAGALLRAIISIYWPKYLDKKQPKPKEKKHRKAVVQPLEATPVMPDLTPEEVDFTVEDITAEQEETAILPQEAQSASEAEPPEAEPQKAKEPQAEQEPQAIPELTFEEAVSVPAASAKATEAIIEDEELTQLLNRPIDDILGKNEKEEKK